MEQSTKKKRDIQKEIKPIDSLLISRIDTLSKAILYSKDELESIEKQNDQLMYILPKAIWYRMMFSRGATTYGPAVEKYLRIRLGYDKVASNIGRGDYLLPDDTYAEEKGSFSMIGKYNLVQIRTDHKIDSYFIVLVAFDKNNDLAVEEHIFHIPAQHIHDKAIEWGLAHGTKLNTLNNTTKEKRITFYHGDEIWQWLQQYRIEVKDLI